MMGGPITRSDMKDLRVEVATFGEASVVTDAPSWLSLSEPKVEPWLPQSINEGVEGHQTTREVRGAGLATDGSGSRVAGGAEASGQFGEEPAEREKGPSAEEHEAAIAEARTEVADALQQPYLRAAANLHEVAQRLEREMDESAVRLAVELASAILTREASADPEILRATVRRALEEAGPVVSLALRVHPEDLAQTRAEAPAMAEDITGQVVDLSVSSAADVERGTCVVQFDRGIVDTRWSTQLRHLADAARQALEVASQQPERAEEPEEETR